MAVELARGLTALTGDEVMALSERLHAGELTSADLDTTTVARLMLYWGGYDQYNRDALLGTTEGCLLEQWRRAADGSVEVRFGAERPENPSWKPYTGVHTPEDALAVLEYWAWDVLPRTDLDRRIRGVAFYPRSLYGAIAKQFRLRRSTVAFVEVGE